MKKIIYHMGAKNDFEKFPDKVKQRVARLIEMIAEGLDLQPKDFKYIGTVGVGVYELRVKADKHYRVFYVAKFEEALYILHAFIKKTPQTSQHDIEKAKERYKALLRSRG